ncbi:hypothetical protein MN116_008643 [Schistosoma mekongi]|uniref:non-specific serine/threonine protein kinase n=1 Tax=Schistosoma mekongi TaxID=38744 RepID=A0AAE2D1A4_SCHME|nr:hypothetical protein MN116_008643 [Schistosoma mekongi]
MANSKGKNEVLQQRKHPPQLCRQMEQDEIIFPQSGYSEADEYNLEVPLSVDHENLPTRTITYATSSVHATTVSSDRPTLPSPVSAIRHYLGNRPHLPPPQDSSSTGSATTGGTSGGSQSDGNKRGSSGSGKFKPAYSSVFNRGTRCSSSASSSTEETEAREKRFGSVDLHPLPSVALTAMMNQVMRRTLYTESSIQRSEQLQYATLLAAHKSCTDSSSQIDMQMSTPSIPASNNNLVSLLSHTTAHTNFNSAESSAHNTSVQINLSQFNHNFSLQLIPPNLWPRLICPIHSDSLFAQISQTLFKSDINIDEIDNKQTKSNSATSFIKNKQVITNVTSSSTIEESRQVYNSDDSRKQVSDTTVQSAVPQTNICGMPTMMYSCNLPESNNNNNIVQSNAPQRIGPYYLGPTLGRGNFAVVKLGKHSQLSVKVAIKIMNKDLIGSKNLGKVSRELEAMKRCQHPHIIRLYHVMETESNIFMVTEYASKGEVFDHISLSHAFTEKEARELFWQIVCAIEFCHASGIVHRDLKAENLLLDADFKIKVADFGFCNFFQNDQLLSTHCGSPQYAAPELFKGEPYDGTLADVWSLGVILYILVCGSFPFPGESLGDIRTQVLRGLVRFPFYLSTSCEQVIRCMLQVDPIRRYKLKQVMTTAWMQESPNVEHYKSLINKYQLKVKERQFEVLFRHQHPEHSKIAEEEFLERIDFKLDVGIMKALSSETGLDEEQIRQSTIQRKYDRYHAAYELLKEKIKTFYRNPILRKFVNDETKKQPSTFIKQSSTQRHNQRLSWQPTSNVLGECNPSSEQTVTNRFNTMTSTTQSTTALGVLDETMLEEQTPPHSDINMSSDSSDSSDVPMRDHSSLSCTSGTNAVTMMMNTVDITPSGHEESKDACIHSEHSATATNVKKDFRESSSKEWKCATQPKNTELNAAIYILKADEDEILSNFGINSAPIDKSFSNSTRRHTLQFATSLFRKSSNQRDNLENVLSTNNDMNDLNNRHSSTTTVNTVSVVTSNTKGEKSPELTGVNININCNVNNDNNVKRTTVRRFPRQITQPHPNRFQYNQNNPENSDQMLLTRLDWMPNTWETTHSDYKKSHLSQSSRPYLRNINKQNEQTLTSLELGQEAATTKQPLIKTNVTTTDDEEGEQDDVSILIDHDKILPDAPQAIQVTEDISLGDCNNVAVLNLPDMHSERCTCSLKTEYTSPDGFSYESTPINQSIPSQYTDLQPTSHETLLLDRIPEQISVDLNTQPNAIMDNTTHLPTEKSTVLEDPCWSTIRISAEVNEVEDENSCDPTAGVLHTLLPQLNLPANLPAMKHQPVACFTVKDPNLLAPPEFMTPHSSSFPRRSSDGAADLQPLHRPVITVGGSYPEQANYRKENSGAESENSSLAAINAKHTQKPDSIQAPITSMNSTNLPNSENYEVSKQSLSSSSQQLPESRSRLLAAQQRSFFSALHSQRRRLPLELWWKLTHKKFNQTGDDIKSGLWNAQLIRHQKRFSLPVNCGPIRQASGKTELQCKCHHPLTSELLQEIQQKLRNTSWIQKTPTNENIEIQCVTNQSKLNVEELPEKYRRGSEASQMSAWEQRLRQYNDLYDPGAHAQITSTFHQPVLEIETHEDEDVDEEKLESNYSFFTFPYSNDTFNINTQVTDEEAGIQNLNPLTVGMVDSAAETTTNTSPSRYSQYKSRYISSSVKDDNPLNSLVNEPYKFHMSAPNASPISQSGIELTDLKTELHNLEVERSTLHSPFGAGIHLSSEESSRSVDDNKIHNSNESTHLPELILSSETSNISSFLSDRAINMQQSTLPIKYAPIPNEQSPSTSSYTHWSISAFDNKVHRRASSVVDAPTGLNYLIPPDKEIYNESSDNIRRHRHSVGEMFDDKNSKCVYEYCSGLDSYIFDVNSESQQPILQNVSFHTNSEGTNITQVNDEMSIKSFPSFTMVTTPTSTSINNTSIGQRLFDRLHPERSNYLHILQHSGGSLDRRLNSDFLRSPRKKIYQEWLPKLTELSHKALDAARDKMNKVRATSNPQSLVYNLVHSDILYPSSTHSHTTSKSSSVNKDERDNECCIGGAIDEVKNDQITGEPQIHNDVIISTTIGGVASDKDQVAKSADVDPNLDVDPDVDEEEDDEEDCALAPLQTHVINASNPSIHYHSSRPRHRITNQNIGQNLTYPQQVMPFFHGNLLSPSTIQQQHQNTSFSQLPIGLAGVTGYGLQDLVDLSNPQALPAAAAAASLLLFRSSDDDEDLAAIDRVNQRLALGRLTGNLSDTGQLINEYPNLLGGTMPCPPLPPQPQSLLLPTIQTIRPLPIAQPIHQAQFSHSTAMNETSLIKESIMLQHDYSQSSTMPAHRHTTTEVYNVDDNVNASIISQSTTSYDSSSNYQHK